MNTEEQKRYHFIGIGGIGMSALASILLQKGMKVTGSDMSGSLLIDRLKKQGAEVKLGHEIASFDPSSSVVVSTAIKEENLEVKAARLQNLPFIHRSELLHQLMLGYKPLLVTGTHGKTTTSSLLAHVLVHAGLDPSYAIGGMVSSLGSNGGHGKGEYFVAEADESDGSFLNYTPFGAIVTNIDSDHLDHWKNMEGLMQGFNSFATSVISKKDFFWCGDDDRLKALDLAGTSYGFDERNDLCIKNFMQQGWKSTFDLSLHGQEYGDVEIPLVGAHNVLNASAVFGLCLQLGLSEEKIRAAFLAFRGVGRRAELKVQYQGITILDDYAHHPAEIFATLRALKKAIGKRRLVVAFQPHRYTRTRDCFHEFATAFESADLLVITDIYAASEQPIAGVSASSLVQEIGRQNRSLLFYCSRKELAKFLAKKVCGDDLLVTMGAGDITYLGSELLQVWTGTSKSP